MKPKYSAPVSPKKNFCGMEIVWEKAQQRGSQHEGQQRHVEFVDVQEEETDYPHCEQTDERDPRSEAIQSIN